MAQATKNFEERLQAHPQLKDYVLELLELAESGIESADKVEELVVEGIRGMGREVIQEWAERQEAMKGQALRETDAEASAHEKKTPLDDHARGDRDQGTDVQVGGGVAPAL